MHLLPKSVAAGVTAGLLLAACGTGDNDLSAFCREVKEVNDDFAGNDDDAALIDALGDVDPPAELAKDWRTMVDNWDEFSDPEDLVPENGAQDIDAAVELEQRAAEFDRAARAVTTYLRDECSFDL